MKNNTGLIIVLVALALMKFIIVPVIEWQDNLVEETAQLERKIVKSARYINDLPELIKYQKNLTQQVKKSQEQIETYFELGRYQLSKQRQIEELFTQYNVKIKTLNWQDEVKTKRGASVKLNLQYSGQLKSFIKLKLALLALNSSTEVSLFGVNISLQGGDSLGKVNGTMSLVFSPRESDNADS